MVKSLLRLQAQDLGVYAGAGADVRRRPAAVRGQRQRSGAADFRSEFLERVRALPGVTHVSARSTCCRSPPPVATDPCAGCRSDRRATKACRSPSTAIVMDRYFETMGMPVLAGRALDERDRLGTPVWSPSSTRRWRAAVSRPRSAGGDRAAAFARYGNDHRDRRRCGEHPIAAARRWRPTPRSISPFEQ